MAVLMSPLVLAESAKFPEAVLPLPVVLAASALNPEAVLARPKPGPGVTCVRVDEPVAVLAFESLVTELHPGAAHVGVCACTQLELNASTTAKVQ
jgi:hypothetical protein